MALKIFLLITLMSMCSVRALPRDSSVLRPDTIAPIQDTLEPKKENAVILPGQVLCKFDAESEEPSEDVVCQELCLPKGYSYGICVGGKCSCI